MRNILFAATALLISTAACAQVPPQPGWNGGPPPPGWHGGQGWDREAFWHGAPDGPRERIQFLQDRVDRGLADGSLDRGEAARVTHELNGVRGWIQRMHWQDAGQLGPDQRARVQARLDQISQQIRWMHRTGW